MDNELYKALAPLGLKEAEYERIKSHYGISGACELLRVNPYKLALEQFTDFRVIDGYVMSHARVSTLCPARMSAALLYTLYICEQGSARSCEDSESMFDDMAARASGSTCIPKSSIYRYIEALLSYEEGTIDMAMLDKCIKHLALAGKISVNRVGDRLYLATKAAYTAEKEAAEAVCRKLSARRKRVNLRRLYNAIDSAMASTGKLLSQEQKSAVSMILQNKLSVLTGGPGTGKTQTELVLIKSMKILDPSSTVRCIAPTGQAARRMTDATGYPATTIHKALGLVPGKRRDKTCTLSESLIICDEASMIDAFLFRELMDSISDESTIVFVGDVAQLPSVSAGNVLAELIAADSVPVTRLTKIFRQGDNSIAFNCAKIQAGNPQLDFDKSFRFIEKKSSSAIRREVVELYKKEVADGGLDSVVVLTPYRRSTQTGVNRLNIALRSALTDTDGLSFCENREGIRIYAGDKITFLRNRDGLVNGETGTAVKCYPGTAICRFGEKELTLKGDELDWIEPAFAQTVHKSQGLEYPTCIIVLDEKHSNMLSREIIYTAISRSKKTCICVGQEALLEAAILPDDAVEASDAENVRWSCLAGLIDSFAQKKNSDSASFAGLTLLHA